MENVQSSLKKSFPKDRDEVDTNNKDGDPYHHLYHNGDKDGNHGGGVISVDKSAVPGKSITFIQANFLRISVLN